MGGMLTIKIFHQALHDFYGVVARIVVPDGELVNRELLIQNGAYLRGDKTGTVTGRHGYPQGRVGRARGEVAAPNLGTHLYHYKSPPKKPGMMNTEQDPVVLARESVPKQS